MTDIIFFAAGIAIGIAVHIIRSSDDVCDKSGKAATNKVDEPLSEQAKKQKELERQYNNLLNYDGRAQRGVDDEN